MRGIRGAVLGGGIMGGFMGGIMGVIWGYWGVSWGYLGSYGWGIIGGGGLLGCTDPSPQAVTL